MKRARIGIIAAAIFAVASVAFAQAKPDFSGTWTLDPEASGMAAPAGGGAPGGGGGGGRRRRWCARQRRDDQADRRHAHHRAHDGREQGRR